MVLLIITTLTASDLTLKYWFHPQDCLVIEPLDLVNIHPVQRQLFQEIIFVSHQAEKECIILESKS